MFSNYDFTNPKKIEAVVSRIKKYTNINKNYAIN